VRESEEARKELEMKGHTLVLAGELDRLSAPVLETEIERLCEAGVMSLTLDVRALSEIDSVGVAVIVHRCGWCARRGCHMSLLADSGPVQRAFAEAGAGGRVEFIEDRATAAVSGVGAQTEQPEQEPARARAPRPRLVRPNAFAPPGKAALAAATGYGDGDEARSASLLRVSGRWARTRRSRRGRGRR
jgi:anti-anti-sigma factor